MSRKIFFATGNAGKVEEMTPLFEDRDLELVQVETDVPEIDAMDVEEVARQKVKDSFEAAKEKGAVEYEDTLIIEDTGFYVEGLDGFPGAEAAFFAETAGAGKLLNLLEYGEDRSAYFKTAIALIHDGEIEIFTGRMEGKVPKEKRGVSHPHLPYNSFFIPDHGDGKSLAENQELKEDEFHRRNAVENFLEWYGERNF
ncbi:MAG: non-canonical purine NTP pyrophosphatase [Candidatus Nanosalina sp.]